MQPTTTPQTPEQDDAYYRAILHDLIERGTDLARRNHEAAVQPPQNATTPDTQPEPQQDPTIAFDRIARAIRRTIALARHIAENPAASRATAHRDTAAHRTEARKKIIRTVEDKIYVRNRVDRDVDAEALYTELNERLLDPELEFDLQNRDIDDIIAEITQDLGVARQGRAYIFKRRKPKDIAALRARAAAPPGQASNRLPATRPTRPRP
jgi:hypothetical protein